MIEWIPLLIAGGALIPNTLPMNEKKRIMQVFENTDFCITREGEKEYPMYIKRDENDNAKIYYFQLPLGLSLKDAPDLADKMSDSLNRQIEIVGNSVIEVRIYKMKLTTKFLYEDVPEPKHKWDIPIGKTYQGLLWHNFDESQHMTVAGTTRWGKTNFLKMTMTYLIEHYADDVEFYILDLKAGLAFHKYRNLKQVKRVASNFDECERVFKQIRDHIEERETFFKEHDYEDIIETPYKKRTFILIDEAGELTDDKGLTKEEKQQAGYFTSSISHIARVSAGLGFRMVFATQYPTADILPRQLKANASARIAFRLETTTQSNVAIEEPDAAELPFRGRLIYKNVDRYIAQAPLIKKPDMWERLRRWEVDSTSQEDRTTGEDTIIFR